MSEQGHRAQRALNGIFGSVGVAGLALLAACGAYGGPMGVTTGGAQDVGYARNAVAAGQIPPASAFVIEGLLSEHDIAVQHAPCEELLCFDAAVGVAPALDTGRDTAFMVVGFSTGMAPGALRRPALNLALVIDRSGSMAGAKMAAAREAAHRVVDQLGPDDRLTVIAFDDGFDVLVEAEAVTEARRRRIHARVDDIDDDGGTDLEGALALALEELEDGRGGGREGRVLMVTDAQPTVGARGESAFVGLAAKGAAEGVGLTLVGVGLDVGQDLALAMSRVPGANYVYVETAEKLERLGEDFDMLVTPLAWDFTMRVEPVPGYRVARAYGVPSWVSDAGGGAVDVHVPTLFPSRNRGAIVLALEPAEGGPPLGPGPLARRELAYRERRGEALRRFEGEVVVPAAEAAADAGVAEAVALVNVGLGLQSAAALGREGRYEEALIALAATREVAEGEDLAGERELVDGLEAVVREHARREDGRVRAAWEDEEAGRDPRWIR